jgi:mannose-1-phosphate guanylyltransferase/mannose-6-phosphate isomerase
VVGNEEHRFLVLDQLRELKLPEASLLLEPSGRNTAPAMTLAALHATEDGADPVLVVTPADQTVTDEPAFTRRCSRRCAPRRRRLRDPRRAARSARDRLRLHPRRATRARRRPCRWPSSSRSPTCHRAALPADGAYFWNSGMFVVRARCG